MTKTTLDNPGSKVLPPFKLAHVVLRTSNYEKMTTFYRTFLGGETTFENEMMSLFRYDEEDHRIGILNIPPIGPKNPGTCGLEHIAFAFRTHEDLALAYLQRKNNGILPYWCVNHGPSMSAYYKDPDGNVLETFVSHFETLEESLAFVESEQYQINPIGVDFDMEDMIGRLKAGEDKATIQKQPKSGPRGVDSVPQ